MALVALALIAVLGDIRVEVHVALVRLLAALQLSTELAVARRHREHVQRARVLLASMRRLAAFRPKLAQAVRVAPVGSTQARVVSLLLAVGVAEHVLVANIEVVVAH
jgi:hypothetical protein